MIELRTMGSFELTRSSEGDVSAELTQPKRLALLVYLAAARPRGFHRRDTLLALFWPELDTQHAGGALSQALSHLREVLGSGIVVSRGRSEVGIDPDRLWCDAAAFEDTAREGDAERALALYRGDFCQGLHVPGVMEFERWLEDERARRRDLAIRLAWTLAEQEERTGHAATAAHWARRAAALTVNDEVAVRRQIALLERLGDRAGALAVYDEFARRFAADYGVAPSSETQAFIRQVRSLDRVAGRTSPAPPSAGVDSAIPALHAPARRSFHVQGALAVVVALVVGVLAAEWARPQPPPQLSWFDLALHDSATPRADFGFDGAIALSPDGSLLAYVGASTRSLFLRALDEPSLRRVAGSDGANCPSFSPDGRWIAFTSSSRLKKVAVRGGSPITITDSVAGCGVWTDRNEILFNGREHLYRVPADGGPVSLVTRRDSTKRIGAMVPSYALPGGRAALICLSEDVMAKWQIAVVALPSGQITRLTAGGSPRCPARYANGYVVFGQKRAIVAAPFSVRALRFTGPEAVLVRDTMAYFSTAGNRSLAYISAAPQTHSLVAVSEGGNARRLGGSADERRLRGSTPMPLDTGRYAWPRLSPDGKRVVMEMLSAGPAVSPGGPWVYDIASRTLSRLTGDRWGIQPLGWTSNGREIVFTQIDSGNIGGPRRIVAQPWDGSAPAREFISFPARFTGSIYTLFDISVGPPHGYAAFVIANFSDSADIWIAPLDTPTAARPLVATRAREAQPRLSPDGSLLAYTSDETGREEVYVRSLLGRRRLQVSAEGGWQPLWSVDGHNLFYRAPGYMMRARIFGRLEFTLGSRDTLFRDVFSQHDVVNYDIFPNGKELLMIRPNAPAPAHIAVVLNWPELLRP